MCMQVLLQTRALGLLPASDSSVIVATEPLWAAGFASLLLGEVLDSSAQLGGLLILLGCLSNTLLSDDLGINFGLVLTMVGAGFLVDIDEERYM